MTTRAIVITILVAVVAQVTAQWVYDRYFRG